RKAAAAHARRVKALAAVRNQKPETRNQKGARGRVLTLPATFGGSNRTFWPLSSDFWHLNPAGHGVHPLFFMAPPQQRKVG
ncbi:MAG: hypothetical protein ACREE7_14020, partial [Dongiaceae bacterium]